jgi:hypothetical protein
MSKYVLWFCNFANLRPDKKTIKPQLEGDPELSFAEIQFFFFITVGDEELILTLVSLYLKPDLELLGRSNRTVWACLYQGNAGLAVVAAKSIISAVAMVPLIHREENVMFVVEKLGLEVACLAGIEEELTDE